MKGIKYLLSDLDGVIRHYPLQRNTGIEQEFSLTPGSLLSAAFEKTLLSKAVCGFISDEDWRTEIVKSLSKSHPPEVAASAVQKWSDFPGIVDHSFLAFIETECIGLPVAVLTNGTSRLKKDLAKLEIESRFFKVFNSAEIGLCKPDKKLFTHVVQDLGCEPSDVLFVDDSISHVQAAQEVGMRTHHYKSFDEFKKVKFIEVGE